MDGLIIYKSKYGATAQYAKWLGEQLMLPVYTADRTGPEVLENAGYVLIGTSVYIGKLLLKKWLRKSVDVLKGKKIFLFIVCGSGAADVQQHEAIIKDNLPGIFRNQAAVFFLPGRLVREKLSLKDRILLNMGALLEKDPVKKKGMRSGMNGVDKSALSDLVKSVSLFRASQKDFTNTSREEAYLN